MSSTKSCVACTLEIPEAAGRCPNCRAAQEQPGGFHRGHSGRVIAGVCAAFARHFGIDAWLVRLAMVIGLVVSAGTAFGVYVLFWILTPNGPGQRPPAARFMDSVSRFFTSAPDGQPIREPNENP
jgi:phage shock protein C